MDPLLLALTIVSLVSAAGFGALAWHLLRQDRSRSGARVAALSAAIEASEAPAAHANAAAPQPVAVSGLFAAEPSAAARGNPLIKAAVGAVMALLLIVALAMSGGRPAGEADTAPAMRGAAPIELISMRHTREGDKLTISGLVRNPRAARTVTRITAVVFAFDRNGAFAASGRAPLDFTTLEPGDESPFVVTIPGVADVGRYRVSFRTDTGVVRHIDRRAEQMRLAAVKLQ